MNAPASVKITAVNNLNLRVIAEIGEIEPAWNPGGRMVIRQGGGSVVEIETDAGITGIGPGVAPELLPAIEQHLIGQDPFAVEQHMSTLNYYAAGLPYQGMAGVDIALWDLIGKVCGQPCYKLWGGFKDKVPGYASMVQLSTPEERAELAVQLADAGWQALKMRIHFPTLQEDLAAVEAVRNAIGDRMEIMVDANQAQSSGRWQPGIQWDYRRALNTARGLEELGCYWLEEPLPRYAFDQIAQLNASVGIPIAGGENNRGVHEFLQMLQQNVYDVIQPESMVGDGITALRKIGALTEAFGKQIAPHHGGRGLGTIAHLHLIASWPHSTYLEMLHDPPIASYESGFAILTEPPIVDSDGFVQVPQRPGLGVELNRELII